MELFKSSRDECRPLQLNSAQFEASHASCRAGSLTTRDLQGNEGKEASWPEAFACCRRCQLPKEQVEKGEEGMQPHPRESRCRGKRRTRFEDMVINEVLR